MKKELEIFQIRRHLSDISFLYKLSCLLSVKKPMRMNVWWQ